ncbi:unnamed protein product [Rotaria sp. Silwood1]|nr:unnamed protein product [Rotaria sp. Silwood1]
MNHCFVDTFCTTSISSFCDQRCGRRNHIPPNIPIYDGHIHLNQSENPPSDTTKSALNVKVWRILNRNQVNDSPRSGAPPTTTTPEYIQAVKNNLRLTKSASMRNVNTKLQQQGFKT